MRKSSSTSIRYHFKPMPTNEDREAFEEAIEHKDSSKIREFLQRDDAKELLLMKGQYGYLPIHDGCRFRVDESCLQLFLDAAVKHGIVANMLEDKDNCGRICLHFA